MKDLRDTMSEISGAIYSAKEHARKLEECLKALEEINKKGDSETDYKEYQFSRTAGQATNLYSNELEYNAEEKFSIFWDLYEEYQKLMDPKK